MGTAAAPEIKIDRSLTKALKRFDADRFRWLDEAAALGPLVGLRMGPVKTWVLTDPEAARAILVTDPTSWTRPPALLAPIRIGVGENLFTQPDKTWSTLQPSVAPAFRKKALESRLADLDALIEHEIGAIPCDTTIDLELAMGRIALRAAAWVLLGEELDPARAEEIAHHQREVVGWVGVRVGQLSGFLPLALGARARTMQAHRAVLNAYADEVIARAQTNSRSDDVLGALLGARPSGKSLTPEALRGHVLGLFLAGNETTAAALSWALVHAAGAPREWAGLRDEPEARVTPFINESLRLAPAVWGIPRTPTKAGITVTSGDLTTRVRRGQLVTVYLRAINRDPDTWSEPLTFSPSRHDTAAKEQQRALIPFGLGPRGCIGQHLAIAEMRAALPTLARKGDVVIEGPIVEDPKFALRLRGGLRGRFIAAGPVGADG